ncbi:hypothetical protein GOP47_0006393 [Adiantum capillus-veneris]|uniref:Uncharacterized protein n=1 Tax=Adiantum capillus-veneris TaxID=13818 RepID=A0A9D4V3L5_ADICA|nr:hypothetical protein GOP47_0006393 [Adiantum capillus-veneris]
MAEHGNVEHRDRGLFHGLHLNKDKKQDEVVDVHSTHVHSSSTVVGGKPVDTKVEVKKHAHLEHLAETGVMLGGAMAMYEKHQAKKDPEHAHKHKIGEAVASAVVAGSTVYAKHEHDEKKHHEKEEGKHHLFGHHSHNRRCNLQCNHSCVVTPDGDAMDICLFVGFSSLTPQLFSFFHSWLFKGKTMWRDIYPSNKEYWQPIEYIIETCTSQTRKNDSLCTDYERQT